MNTGSPAPANPQLIEKASQHEQRAKLLKKIENERNSKALLYVTGDRPGMETQIGQDVIAVEFH